MASSIEKREQRIVVTVTPPADRDELLRVDDALEQVLAFLRIADEQKEFLDHVQEDFEWRLVSATTNSPFTVVAAAVPLDPRVDISAHVTNVKRLTASLIQGVLQGDPIPGWMRPEGIAEIRSLFRRNANGIGRTLIDFEDLGTVEINQASAEQVAFALEPTSIATESPARTAHGEIEGRLVAVGRYRNRPALHIMTSLYGPVWCVLANHLVAEWGDEQKVSDVWRGKRLTVFGRLIYWRGGKLSRVEAQNVRERETPTINIADVLDPEFTSGLDPVEYLERLHEGELG